MEQLITYPTWERYTILSHAISNLTIRDRRRVFQLARSQGEASPDLFLPRFGFTVSEFAVWHMLGSGKKRNPHGVFEKRK